MQIWLAVFAHVFAPIQVPKDAVALTSQQESLGRAGSRGQEASDADLLYSQSIYLLRRGRQFRTAADSLRMVVNKEPGSSRYQSALGCALASRAASVGYAACRLKRYADDQALYNKLLADWKIATGKKDTPPPSVSEGPIELPPEAAAATQEQRQRIQALLDTWVKDYKQNHFSVDSPPPTPPRLSTRDDGKPFIMTEEEARLEFKRLSTEALAAFDESLRLVRAESDTSQAEQAWTRACALRLMSQFARFLKVDIPIRSVDIEAAYQQAATLKPDNPVYWQSLGDYYLGSADGVVQRTSPEVRRKAIAAYQKALTLRPRQTDLWFQMYRVFVTPPSSALQGRGISQKGGADPEKSQSANPPLVDVIAWDVADALDALRRAQQSDRSNSFLAYHLATLLVQNETDFRSSRLREARTLLIDAAKAPNCRPILYQEPTSPLLTAAWSYWNADSEIVRSWPNEWGSLVRNICRLSLIEVSAPDGDQAEALSVLRSLLGIEKQIVKSLPRDLMQWGNREHGWDMVGQDVLNETYRAMIAVYHQKGDQPGEYQLRRERQSALLLYKERQAAYLKALPYRYGSY